MPTHTYDSLCGAATHHDGQAEALDIDGYIGVELDMDPSDLMRVAQQRALRTLMLMFMGYSPEVVRGMGQERVHVPEPLRPVLAGLSLAVFDGLVLGVAAERARHDD